VAELVRVGDDIDLGYASRIDDEGKHRSVRTEMGDEARLTVHLATAQGEVGGAAQSGPEGVDDRLATADRSERCRDHTAAVGSEDHGSVEQLSKLLEVA
jgi:hypothetical protein